MGAPVQHHIVLYQKPRMHATVHVIQTQLPVDKNCHIRLKSLCCFCYCMLECTTAIYKVTVVKTQRVLCSTEEKHYGATVITVTRLCTKKRTVH